jgi:hypothetical protein
VFVAPLIVYIRYYSRAPRFGVYGALPKRENNTADRGNQVRNLTVTAW